MNGMIQKYRLCLLKQQERVYREPSKDNFILQ